MMRAEIRRPIIAAALGAALLLGSQALPPSLQAAPAPAMSDPPVPGRTGPRAIGVPASAHATQADRRAAGPRRPRVVPRRSPLDPAMFGRLKDQAAAAAEREESQAERTPAPPDGRRGAAPTVAPDEPEDGRADGADRGIALGPTFPALDRDDSFNAGFIFNPPDGALAVGPSSMVVAVNQSLALYDRGGTRLLGPVEFNAFFRTNDFPFDPRAIFDAGNAARGGYGGGKGRFVLLATTGLAYTLAVSQDDAPERPAAAWCTYQLDAVTDGPGGRATADFPGLGMDGDNLYITSNQFADAGFQQARLLVVPKASVYPDATSGACPTATSADFQFLAQPDGSLAFTVQPAHQPDALPGRASGADPAVMYLVNALFPIGDSLVARSVTTTPSGTPGVSTPLLHTPAWVGVGPYDLPASAAQPGGFGRFIDTGDTRLWAGAIDRYGRLYTANSTRTVLGRPRNANPYANTLWYEITPTSPTTFESPARTHVVADRRVAFFFPGVMPGCDGVVRTNSGGVTRCIGRRFAGLQVSGSGPLRPASAYAVLDGQGAPAVRRYQAGVPEYELNDRWGDYPGLSADPLNPTAVWVLGEYAKRTDAWGTAVAAIRPR